MLYPIELLEPWGAIIIPSRLPRQPDSLLPELSNVPLLMTKPKSRVFQMSDIKTWVLFFLLAMQALGAKAPASGIVIADEERAALNREAKTLKAKIDTLDNHLLLPDVIIFHNAVRYALDDRMFYKKEDVGSARKLLELGHERADQLKKGKHPWTRATGLLVRGYRSHIDDSVIPYGVDVPKNFNPNRRGQMRLDIWLHGRNNILSEVRFLTERLKRSSQFRPGNTIVLHPYGRFCNAYKFAGEVDVLESLDHVKTQYPIDDLRITMRGFSMGGAGTWHLGAHYAGQWAAVTLGAGFVDTAIYQNIFTKEPRPTWWEQKLWRLYDVPPIAANFHNTTTVAYSGEIDKQKQATDLMAAAFKKEGMKMTHIIGPKTGHKYEPKAKIEVAKQIDAAALKGQEPFGETIRLTTYSLRNNRIKWVNIHGLKEHWKEARVVAKYLGNQKYRVTTKNITAFILGRPETADQQASACSVVLDGQKITLEAMRHLNSAIPATSGKSSMTLPKTHWLKPLGYRGRLTMPFLTALSWCARPASR
jgi:pimeloyl-ACP methyl ester carboxylesterase